MIIIIAYKLLEGWEIAERLKEISRENEVPGSMQIRLGGVKGMLTIKKDFPANKIGIRPSMCKYPSPHRLLEVKTVAKLKRDKDRRKQNTWAEREGQIKERTLFYAVVLILFDLGVPPSVFLDLQRRNWAEICSKWDAGAVKLLQNPINFDEV